MSDKLSVGQRFERSFVGETLISMLVSVAVLIGVMWNLPDSHIKQTLTPALHPIAASTGLQQKWSMYAPDPVSGLETVEVRVTMADGPDRVWSWQRGDRVIGPFVWYHWQKLKEQVVREPHIAAGIAHWVVREVTAPTEHPTGVVVSFRNELLPAPGEDGPGKVAVTTLHTEKLDGRP